MSTSPTVNATKGRAISSASKPNLLLWDFIIIRIAARPIP